MSNYFRYCSPSLKKLDIFGMNISLNYNKDNMYRTPFGGIVTIILIIILSLLFFNNVSYYKLHHIQHYYLSFCIQKINYISFTYYFKYRLQHSLAKVTYYQLDLNDRILLEILKKQLLQKGKVKAVPSIKYNTEPNNLSLDNNNFMIAVKYDQKNFVTRPMVNITFEKRHYQRYPNEEKTIVPIPLEPCTLEHFNNLTVSSSNWEEIFKQQELSDYLCIMRNETYLVGGGWENDDFQFLKFTMQKCNNDTIRRGSWQPICETNENINKSIDEDSRIQFLFVNYLIQPEKTQSPIQQYLETIFFTVQPEKMYTTANIMLNEQKLITDESIVPISDFNEQIFPNYQSGDYKTSYAIGNFKTYCEIFFLRSKFSTIINRSFLKIDEVISYMGGFCQIFLLVSAVLVNFYNEMVYTIELANRLYDFDISNSYSKQQENKKKSSSLNVINQRNSLNVNEQQNQSNNQINQPINQQKNAIGTTTDSNKQVKIDKKRKLTKFKSNGNENRIVDREDFGLLPLQQIKKFVLEKRLDTSSNGNRKESSENRENSEQKLKLNNGEDNKRESLNGNQSQNQIDSNIMKVNNKNDIEQKQNKLLSNNQSIQKYQTQTYLLQESINDIKVQAFNDMSRGNSNQISARKMLDLNKDKESNNSIKSNLVYDKQDRISQDQQDVINYIQSENQFNKILQEKNNLQSRKRQSLLDSNQIKIIPQFLTKNVQQENEQVDNCNQNSMLNKMLNIDCDKSENQYQIQLKNTPYSITDLNAKKISTNIISTNYDTQNVLSPQNIHKKITINDTCNSFEKQNIFKSNSKVQNTSILSHNNVKKNSNFIFETLGFYNTKSFLEKELSFIIQRDRSLNINFKYIINKLSCGRFFNSKEMQLIQKAKDLVREDLDIFVILDRLKEMEKFKKLLLSNEQQVIFNFFPKPLIKIEDNEKVLNRKSLKQENSEINIKDMKKKTKKMNINVGQLTAVSKAIAKFKNIVKTKDSPSALSDYQKLYNCYEILFIESQKNKQEKQKNLKLFELLGEEMKNIFEIAKLMKDRKKISQQPTNSNQPMELGQQFNNHQLPENKEYLSQNTPVIDQKIKIKSKSKFSANSVQNLDDQLSFQYPKVKEGQKNNLSEKNSNQFKKQSEEDIIQPEILINFEEEEDLDIGNQHNQISSPKKIQ